MEEPRRAGPLVPEDDLDSAKKELLLTLENRLAKNGRGSFVGLDEGLGVITGDYLKFAELVRGGNWGEVYQQVAELASGCLWLMATTEAMHTRDLARTTEAGRTKAAEPDPGNKSSPKS